MLIIVEKEGKRQRVSVESHIAQRDRIEFDVHPPRPNLGRLPDPQPLAHRRETYYRTGRTHDGAPVFEYRAPVRWVESVKGRIYEVKIGRWGLLVHKYKFGINPQPWHATCVGLFSCHELKSRDLEDAKAEALGLVRNILTQILEDLPCR